MPSNWSILIGVLFLMIPTPFLSSSQDFRIIAHRGASGYVVEHTVASTAMAHAMGVDFIEQDIVFTRDRVPVVLHDLTLETNTDVAHRFPDRGREDGRYYVVDFTAEELRQLRKGERNHPLFRRAVYPSRYPSGDYAFPLLFLDEAVRLIKGLDRSTGRTTGFYVELKHPEFHLQQGMDPVPLFMEALREAGALDGEAPCFIQCFHPETLQRIRKLYGRELTLIQLIGKNRWQEGSTDFEALLTEEGIRSIARYADGIGIPLDDLVEFADGELRWKPVKDHAQSRGLLIHPFTLRKETVPAGYTYEQVLAFLAGEGGVDGVFTDFPDIRP